MKERFWSRVKKSESPNECWSWIGAKSSGYGTLKLKGTNTRVFAHRLSYALAFGPLPRGAHICHRCDNPECANPNHLFLGTAADNMLDSAKKGRKAVKINLSQAKRIRRLRDLGFSRNQICERESLSYSIVSDVISGRTWDFSESRQPKRKFQ